MSGAGVLGLSLGVDPLAARPDQHDRHDRCDRRYSYDDAGNTLTRPAGSGGGTLTWGSLSPDTKVLLADGSTKKIKDVDIGDVVVATDPHRGASSGKSVTRLYDHLDTDLTDLTVSDEHGFKTVLHTTQNIRSGRPPRATWISAAQL